MRHLANALGSVPNLKSLNLGCWRHPEEVSNLLNTRREWPFRLESFTCNADLHNIIYPFIRQQRSITDYHISGYIWQEKDRRKVLCSADDQTNCALPKLRTFTGPPEYVRDWIVGRTIDSVVITSASIDDEILELYKSFYRLSQSAQEGIASNNEGRTIAHNVCMDLEVKGEAHHHFPFLLSISNHISLLHIRSLKLQAWDLPDQDSVPRALKSFPALEYFEWHAVDSVHVFDVEWITRFVLACASSSQTVRRITFSSYGYINIRLVWSKVPADCLGKGADKEPHGRSEVIENRATDPELLPMIPDLPGLMTKMEPIYECTQWAWRMETSESTSRDSFWQIPA